MWFLPKPNRLLPGGNSSGAVASGAKSLRSPNETGMETMRNVIHFNGTFIRRLVLVSLLALVAAAITIPAGVWGRNVTVPHKFKNGEIADADEVNANFDELAEGINDNDRRLQSQESTLSEILSLLNELPPSPPLHMECHSRADGIALSWLNPSPYDSIIILKNGLELAILVGDTVTFTDTEISDGGRYSYSILGEAGGAVSARVSCFVELREGCEGYLPDGPEKVL